MDQNQSPTSSDTQPTVPSRAPRKGWSPLAIILALSAGFFAIFLAASGILFMSKSPGAKSGGGATSSLFAKGEVAVLELNGVIIDSKKILKRLDRMEDDSDIKAVVLRINSPGGAVAP